MRIRIIDAFTERPFAGNPAAVCLLDAGDWPDENWMQRVAREMSLSETAFAHPLPDGADADFALRWFTPAVETQPVRARHARHRARAAGRPRSARHRCASQATAACS